MKKAIGCVMTTALLLAGSAWGSLIADDNGGNYSSWGTDGDQGGSGFSPWTFKSQVGGGGGFAGYYLAQGAGFTNWAMYANQAQLGGQPQAVAYREFTGGALAVGQTFNVRFYNEQVNYSGGSVGFTIRNGNATNSAADYNTSSRFEFSFLNGATNYYVYDDSGTFHTAIPLQNTGLDLRFTLTGADSYNLQVVELATGTTNSFNGRTLGGTSGQGLDSVALYNRFAGNGADEGNIRFDNMSVIPEPGTLAMLAFATAGLITFLRRRR